MAYNKKYILIGFVIIVIVAFVFVESFTRKKGSQKSFRDEISDGEKEQLLQVVKEYIEGDGLSEFDFSCEEDVRTVLHFCMKKCLAEYAGVGEGIQKIGIPIENVTVYAMERFAVPEDCDVESYFPKNYSQSLFYAEEGTLYGFWDYGRIVYIRPPVYYKLWFVEKTARGYTVIGVNRDSPIYYETDIRPLGNPPPCNFRAELVRGNHGQWVLQSFQSNIIRQRNLKLTNGKEVHWGPVSLYMY